MVVREPAWLPALAGATQDQGRAAVRPEIAPRVQMARTIEVRARRSSITHIERQLAEEWRLNT